VEARIRPGTERAPSTEPIELPPSYRRLDDLRDSHPARRFLVRRGLDPERLARLYNLGYCGESASLLVSRNRIIIPILQRGKLQGWQALSFDEGQGCGSGQPKYLSAPGMAAAELVYNLDRARDYSMGVIVPEPFDVWRFGPMAMSMFGICSERQRRNLTSAFRNRTLALVTLKSEITATMAKRLAQQFRERMYDRFIVVRVPDHRIWRSAGRAELRTIVAKAAAEEGIEVRYRKIEENAKP
jgi:hypothetical protein